MTHPTRVLVVDDNPDDRALVKRELHRGNPEIQIHEIAQPGELGRALAALEFDLVITDYQLQWSDGLQVLRRVRELAPATPVIMFTGSGSEEVAVEAMKMGLDDYVLKSAGQFKRLYAAVHTALMNREHRREMREAEQRYRELFDTVPVGLFRSEPNGKILQANLAFLEVVGCSTEKELAARTLADLHHDPREFRSWRDVLERHGAVASFETRFRTIDSSAKWVEIHAKALRDPQGAIFYEGSVEDITQRKLDQIEKEHLIHELQHALGHVKNLSGLLPICASCKKIRDQEGKWNVLELYIKEHSDADFTHSFCPECARTLYPEVFMDRPNS